MGSEISKRSNIRRPRSTKRSPLSTVGSVDVESNYGTYGYGGNNSNHSNSNNHTNIDPSLLTDLSSLDLTLAKLESQSQAQSHHSQDSTSPTSTQKKTLNIRRKKRKDGDKPTPNFSWMHGDSFNDTHAIGLQSVVKTHDDRDRMKAEHEVFKYVLNGSFKAPMHDRLTKGGAQVLDVGCGVCAWTLDNARIYTQSEFHGIDIDGDLFPTTIPSNCSLVVGDISNPLPYNDNTFDFVFSRNMGSSTIREEWPRLLSEFVRICKPGGYIELIEPNFKLQNTGPTFTRWNNAFSTSFESRDFDSLIGPNLACLLDDIPNISVGENDYVSAPVGWGGMIGELALHDVKMAFVTMKQGLLTKLNLSNEQYDEMIRTCLKECVEYETFIDLHYAYAQKDGLVE